jgi:hypothetical protein
MKPLVFIFSCENIFQSAKMEASQFAVRRFDKDGNNLFEELVFDEAYIPKFRELFFDGQAEIIASLSAYMKDVPVNPVYLETQDFSKDRDFRFELVMDDDFNFHLVKAVDIKIKEFLVAYILYRWLETKTPEYAAIYLERLTKVKEEIKKMLEIKTKPLKRWHGYWT